uniref:Cysteine-rich protein 2 n=1 Tax=Bubo bubo TaxID=30461 RepID=A0A8C0FUW6_BUBBB
MCPRCGKRVYFAEKVTSLGKDWHRPCLRCERCSKTLTPGGHAEHDGQPYCHKPCYGILFGPKGVNTGAVGSYIYDKDPEAMNLTLKRCSGWDLALLKTPPLPLSCCSLEPSLPSTGACLLPALAHVHGHGAMGSVPLQRDKLAAAPKQLTDVCVMVLAPGGTLNGRRSGDPKCWAAAVFPASLLQHRLMGAQFIALLQHADGFHTPALGVFIDSLPVKQARGHILQAPEVLPCSRSTCSPPSLPLSLQLGASARRLHCAALLPCGPTDQWDESGVAAMSRMHVRPRWGIETRATDPWQPTP